MHVYKEPDVNTGAESCLFLWQLFLCKTVNCNSICSWEKGWLICCGHVHDLIQVYEETPF